jgi:hypothetical protein
VLSAIDLNDDQPFAADEIADVIVDRLLSNKFVSIDLPVADAIPENRFRIGLIETQAPRDPCRSSIWATHCLAPHPDCFAIRPLPALAGRG